MFFFRIDGKVKRYSDGRKQQHHQVSFADGTQVGKSIQLRSSDTKSATIHQNRNRRKSRLRAKCNSDPPIRYELDQQNLFNLFLLISVCR